MKISLVIGMIVILITGCASQGTGDLFRAVKSCDLDLAKRAIANGANVNEKLTKYGDPALLEISTIVNCTDDKKIELAKLLISNGADVNAKDYFLGYTLLLSTYTDRELAKLLISNGADVNAKDKYGKTILHHIVSYEPISVNYDKDKYKKADYEYAQYHLELIKFYLANGADINAVNNEGDTALHLCSSGRPIYNTNISFSVDIPGRTFTKKDPIYNVYRHHPIVGYKNLDGDLDIIKGLIESGANVDAMNYRGETPLDLARHHQLKETEQILRTYTRNPIEKDSSLK